MSEFTWKPIYAELADTILQYRERQDELLELMRELTEKGFRVIRMVDQFADGSSGPMREIDPFTFFANFNRGITDDNRRGILAELKKRFSLQSDVPSDFAGIPVADNRASWFVHYAKKRAPEDIPLLWDLAAAARAGGPETLDAELFANALAVGTVAIAKLTMGLFWMQPDAYLSLDSVMKSYLAREGVTAGGVTDLPSYLALLDEVRSRVGGDFPRISLDAWESSVKPPKRFWAGGRFWGDDDKLEEFEAENVWQPGYKRDTSRRSGQKTWELFDQIRPGDELAIKGFGGKNDLKIYYVGEVVRVDSEKDRLELRKLERKLYQGKGPKGASPGWFQTLTEVTDPDAVRAVFHGEKTVEKGGDRPVLPVEIKLPRNLILYGPPGTGKTYKMLQWANEYFTDKDVERGDEPATEELQQVPLWQVLARALAGAGPMTVPELMRHPLVEAKMESSTSQRFTASMWGTLQSHTKQDCPNVGTAKRSEPLLFWKDEESRWSAERGEVEGAIGSIEDGAVAAEPAAARRYTFVTFHQSYSYEDFVEGIRPGVSDEQEISYEVVPGAFRRIATRALNDPLGRPHAIFIDEINRGNIAKILGELITLLEEDKRLDSDNGVTVQLPYSGDSFSVPANLWVIGSMNTADRSISLLDMALRRRFDFDEIEPDPDVVRNNVGDGGVLDGIDVAALMDTLNERIEFLCGRDQRIGHSYFLGARSLNDLKAVFADRIVPLLTEYFYDDWEKACLVLGCPRAEYGSMPNPFPIIDRQVMNAASVFGSPSSDLEEERVRYSISRRFAKAHDDDLRPYFQSMYETPDSES